MIRNLFISKQERVEAAVQRHALRIADQHYHEYMRNFYREERLRIDPSESASKANEYARLYTLEEDQQHHTTVAGRKVREARAKLDAVLKC